MLKMTIDNEEVLSNNDISIREEILSPSSTILNNVYPKTWEQDKDYVSRFYYPKDYSKLNIQNFSVEPEEAGTTIQVNGNATLTDVDTTKESRVLRLLGQTSQVQYTGKNLVGTTNVSSTTTNGITYSITGDTITINGTATANTTIMTTTNFALSQNTTYTLSFTTVSGSKDNTYMGLRFRRNGSQVAFIQTNTPSSKSMDLTNISDVQLYILSGTVFTNYSFKFQLELGSSATSFEPYVGGTASPNPSYPQNVNVVSGDNTIDICGKNLFNANEVQIGKAWNNASNNGRAVIIIPVEQNVPYTISMNGNNTMEDIYVSYSAKTLSENAINGVGLSQITIFPRVYTSSTNYIILQFNKSSVSLSDIKKLKLQVEKGSTATTYEPYIGSSYPLYLGVENSWKSSKAIQGTFDNNTALASKRIVWFDKEVSNGETMTITCNNSNLRFAVSRTTMNTQSSSNVQSQNSGWQTGTYTITFNSNGYACLTISKTDDSAVAISSLNDNDFTIAYNGNHISNNPIELCKIGTYQDYIYKDNGSWYLHKEIGKVVLNGSENWTKTSDTNASVFVTAILGRNTSLSSSSLSNYFKYQFANAEGKFYFGSSSSNNCAFCMATTYTLESFKTWLSTHNTIVYYVLATPTNTEITDTNLIEQLESLSS